MKIKPFLFAIILFALGCNSGTNETDKMTVEEEVVDTPAISETEGSPLAVTTKPTLWSVEYEDKTNTDKLKKPADIQISSLSATDLINVLNENYPDVHLEFNKISHDTIFVKIPDSEKLTQQMGSTGSYNYMAATVFNLTELDKIKYVKIDFKEGDHGSPGTFTREDFKVLR